MQHNYVWRENVPIHADANAVGQALEELARKLGRPYEGLTANDVVEAAKDAASPLHKLLTWDDAKAAHMHRCGQARLVLRSLRRVVVCDGSPVPILAYAQVVSEAGPAYVPTSIAVREKKLRVQMIADAYKGLQGWRKRYEHVSGLDRVVTLIDKALNELVTLQEQEVEAEIMPLAA